MNDITIGLDQADERALACDIPDEALESTAGKLKRREVYCCFLHCFRSLPRSIKSASPLPLKIRIA